ncbi:MAG: Xaa-Pro aminopeptidase [Chloroflexi bacterium]|jgi:Xaa-Pro aminopeptidase|nr:MAG: Xaa-Pro aminopeptidase [Chloroflexota bacterium]
MARVEGNLDALRREIENSDFDAVVAMSPENSPYASGVLLWTQRSIRDRLALVVLPKKGSPTLIVATQEEGYCREKSWIEDIRGYVQGYKSPIDVLAEVLEEKGLAAGRIGYEPTYLSVDYYEQLVAALPEAQFESSESQFACARMVKSESEIEVLKRAAVATERALMVTYSAIKPGDVESELVARLGSEILRGGAELPAFLYLTIGPNSGHAHPDPTDYRIQPGDLVKTDCGGYFSGYYSDVARTAVLGKATEEQKSIYRRIYQVHEATIKSMTPGTLASEVFEVAVEGYKEAEISFSLSFAGHGVGYAIHETPMLAGDDHTSLEPGMFFSVETRVRWPGKAGYHIEDAVLVTESGPELITNFMDTSQLMEL